LCEVKIVGPGDSIAMTSDIWDSPSVVRLQLLLPEEL
jgi:hypothetical protein